LLLQITIGFTVRQRGCSKSGGISKVSVAPFPSSFPRADQGAFFLAGELLSVSPLVATRVENLFVLNEHRATWATAVQIFRQVPVGTTSGGEHKVSVRTSMDITVLRHRGHITRRSTALPILNDQPLQPEHEIGGFCLGSTIVLVFEVAPTLQCMRDRRCEWDRYMERRTRGGPVLLMSKLITRMNRMIHTTK
jgi:Phosphatidylserine decarboxylase